jgi:hypothetical protein
MDHANNKISIFGDRFLLARTKALSVDFYQQMQTDYPSSTTQETRDLIANILFDLGHSLGKVGIVSNVS